MSEEVGQATMSEAQGEPESKSPNTKIHGEPPPGSPMPGVEREEGSEVKEETNPNTE